MERREEKGKDEAANGRPGSRVEGTRDCDGAPAYLELECFLAAASRRRGFARFCGNRWRAHSKCRRKDIRSEACVSWALFFAKSAPVRQGALIRRERSRESDELAAGNASKVVLMLGRPGEPCECPVGQKPGWWCVEAARERGRAWLTGNAHGQRVTRQRQRETAGEQAGGRATTRRANADARFKHRQEDRRARSEGRRKESRDSARYRAIQRGRRGRRTEDGEGARKGSARGASTTVKEARARAAW